MNNFLKKFLRGMTYKARFQCTNCGKTFSKLVLKGTTKNKFVKTKKCDYCRTTSWIPI